MACMRLQDETVYVPVPGQRTPPPNGMVPPLPRIICILGMGGWGGEGVHGLEHYCRPYLGKFIVLVHLKRWVILAGGARFFLGGGNRPPNRRNLQLWLCFSLLWFPFCFPLVSLCLLGSLWCAFDCCSFLSVSSWTGTIWTGYDQEGTADVGCCESARRALHGAAALRYASTPHVFLTLLVRYVENEKWNEPGDSTIKETTRWILDFRFIPFLIP